MPEEKVMRSAELDEFIDILNAELGLLSSLYEVLREQQEALVAGNTEEISGTVERQIAIVGEITGLEKRRKAVMDRVINVDGDQSEIDAILGVASENQANRISDITRCLKDALDSLGTVNERNGMLIRQSMSYIDSTIKLLAGGGSPAETYTAEGEIECPTREVALNKRI
jgi:flagellar biosynthesis/type III secretory pathway chaperone